MLTPRRLLSALLSLTLAACGQGNTGPTPSPGPQDDGGAPFAHEDGGGPAADSTLPPAGGDLDPASGCPKLDGEWTGTLEGTIVLLLPVAVTGTVSMSLAPNGTPGDYTIQNGKMEAMAKGTSGEAAKGVVVGDVKCGLLDVTNEVDFYGVKTVGNVKCTFTEGGCTGTWNGKTKDGTASGQGTFVLERK
jgi:hypothetical protein